MVTGKGVVLLACLLAGCARLPVAAVEGAPPAAPVSPAVPAGPAAVTLGGVAFHSMQWQVKFAGQPPGLDAAALRRELQAALDDVDAALTTYRPDSELMRFNARPVGEWGPASPLLLQSLQVAADVSRLSGGRYDVTVGPLVELWGFGAAPSPARRPTPEALAAARTRVGWARIGLDPAGGRIARLGDVRADLSSLGEGAGVDALVAVLERAGLRDFLVRVAGTSRQRGQHPGGGPWTLAVERPDGSGLPGRVLRAAETVVSTSGAYRNVRDIEGQRYSHTLDPATGCPVTHDGVSVTVLLPAVAGAMRADALATALNVLGPDRGLELAAQEGLAVLYLERHGGGLRERWSPAFVPWLTD